MKGQDSEYQASIYFSLDEHTVDALELTLEHLQRASRRPMSWKWVVIGIHTALHGSFCLVLRRSDGAQLLIPEHELQTYQRWHRERANGAWEPVVFTRRGKEVEVEPMVDWFLDLYAKVQDPSRMDYLGGVPLEPSESQSESIERLNAHRGVLAHFSDTTFVIDVDEILDLLSDSLEVVAFLLTTSQPSALSTWALANRVDELIAALKSEIESMRELYQQQGRTE